MHGKGHSMCGQSTGHFKKVVFMLLYSIPGVCFQNMFKAGRLKGVWPILLEMLQGKGELLFNEIPCRKWKDRNFHRY